MQLGLACEAQQSLETHCLELYCWATPGSKTHVPVRHEDILVPSPYLHRLEMALFMNTRQACNEEQQMFRGPTWRIAYMWQVSCNVPLPMLM